MKKVKALAAAFVLAALAAPAAAQPFTQEEADAAWDLEIERSDAAPEEGFYYDITWTYNPDYIAYGTVTVQEVTDDWTIVHEVEDIIDEFFPGQDAIPYETPVTFRRHYALDSYRQSRSFRIRRDGDGVSEGWRTPVVYTPPPALTLENDAGGTLVFLGWQGSPLSITIEDGESGRLQITPGLEYSVQFRVNPE